MVDESMLCLDARFSILPVPVTICYCHMLFLKSTVEREANPGVMEGPLSQVQYWVLDLLLSWWGPLSGPYTFESIRRTSPGQHLWQKKPLTVIVEIWSHKYWGGCKRETKLPRNVMSTSSGWLRTISDTFAQTTGREANSNCPRSGECGLTENVALKTTALWGIQHVPKERKKCWERTLIVSAKFRPN